MSITVSMMGASHSAAASTKLTAGPASATASSGSGPVQLVPEELYSLKDDPLQHKNLLIGPRDLAVEQ